MVGSRVWVVVNRRGQMLGAGPTEGQAWLSALAMTGRRFCGWVFLETVEFYKACGDHAVEVVG